MGHVLVPGGRLNSEGLVSLLHVAGTIAGLAQELVDVLPLGEDLQRVDPGQAPLPQKPSSVHGTEDSSAATGALGPERFLTRERGFQILF